MFVCTVFATFRFRVDTKLRQTVEGKRFSYIWKITFVSHNARFWELFVCFTLFYSVLNQRPGRVARHYVIIKVNSKLNIFCRMFWKSFSLSYKLRVEEKLRITYFFAEM